ncbi:MAG: hypothetical protein DHS20C16_13170 [Phycisphaerae bacterium]|nr:MAG: hypothetical protein DHS20C16_13170 [Phycisphaerae bacterium]
MPRRIAFVEVEVGWFSRESYVAKISDAYRTQVFDDARLKWQWLVAKLVIGV